MSSQKHAERLTIESQTGKFYFLNINLAYLMYLQFLFTINNTADVLRLTMENLRNCRFRVRKLFKIFVNMAFILSSNFLIKINFFPTFI